MRSLRPLAHVKVLRPQLQRPGHKLLLMVRSLAGQVEVRPVPVDLGLLGGHETDPEFGVGAGHEGEVGGNLPTEKRGPEVREPFRLQGIDPTYYEAASIDGASAWQRFRTITLPLLAPTTLVVVILSLIAGFQAFDFIWTLTGGGCWSAS